MIPEDVNFGQSFLERFQPVQFSKIIQFVQFSKIVLFEKFPEVNECVLFAKMVSPIFDFPICSNSLKRYLSVQ